MYSCGWVRLREHWHAGGGFGLLVEERAVVLVGFAQAVQVVGDVHVSFGQRALTADLYQAPVVAGVCLEHAHSQQD